MPKRFNGHLITSECWRLWASGQTRPTYSSIGYINMTSENGHVQWEIHLENGWMFQPVIYLQTRHQKKTSPWHKPPGVHNDSNDFTVDDRSTWRLEFSCVLLPRKLTQPRKNDGWKMSFPFGMVPFQGLCSFSGVYPQTTCISNHKKSNGKFPTRRLKMVASNPNFSK